MPANPYDQALAGLPALRSGSRKGLDVIYKAMQANLSRFGQRVDALNTQTGKSIGNEYAALDRQLGTYGKNAVSDVLTTAGFGGPIDLSERALLSNLASDDVTEYQGYAGTVKKGEGTYQTKLRGIDKQFAKDLKAAAVREKQARNAELEQNLLEYGAGLRTQGAAFDAQNQMLSFQGGQTGLLNSSGKAAGLEGAARRYLGVPYKWGGTNPRTGMDCSGFTQRVFADNGVRIPRTSREQYAASQKIPGGVRNAQPGDLLFWANNGVVHHVALYIGNGMMIAAPRRGTVVQVQRVYGNPMVGRY